MGGAVMLSAMSAPGATEIAAVLALFAGFGSFTALLTAAVLAMMPSALVVTLSVTVAFPPLTSVPSEQLTRPALWPHVPCDPLALWNVSEAGNASVTVTAVAICGPALWTTRV